MCLLSVHHHCFGPNKLPDYLHLLVGKTRQVKLKGREEKGKKVFLLMTLVYKSC